MQRKTKFVGAQLARQTASPNAETPLLTPPLSAVSLLDGAEEAMSRQESSSLKGRMSTSPSTEFAKINKAVVIQSSSQDGKVEKSVEETEHDGLSTVSEKCVLSSFSDYNQYKKEMLAEPKKNINLYTTSLERMPSWYADNEFVFTGYRRITNSYKGCFLSLFYVHNETANVYSHFAGAIGFLLSGAAFYSAWTRAVAWDDIAAVGEGHKNHAMLKLTS